MRFLHDPVVNILNRAAGSTTSRPGMPGKSGRRGNTASYGLREEGVWPADYQWGQRLGNAPRVKLWVLRRAPLDKDLGDGCGWIRKGEYKTVVGEGSKASGQE